MKRKSLIVREMVPLKPYEQAHRINRIRIEKDKQQLHTRARGWSFQAGILGIRVSVQSKIWDKVLGAE